jgi:hypothetical protein
VPDWREWHESHMESRGVFSREAPEQAEAAAGVSAASVGDEHAERAAIRPARSRVAASVTGEILFWKSYFPAANCPGV